MPAAGPAAGCGWPGGTWGDGKGCLAYGTAAQVGRRFVGLALEWWNVVLVYVVAHACLRTLQLLRAPSALHDAEAVRAAIDELPARAPAWARWLPPRVADRLYALALEDFFLDGLVSRWIVAPTLALSRAADRLERRWVALISRGDPEGLPEAGDERSPGAGSVGGGAS